MVKDVEGWKIYRHGCMRLNKELLQMKPNYCDSHCPERVHCEEVHETELRVRSDAAKQPRKGAKESETSPRIEMELAGRKPVTKAATLAVLTSQCGGPMDPLWPPRFESWVIPLLVLRACGILVHSPRFCCLTQSVEQWPEVTRAALTVSREKRTCGLLCLTFSAMSNGKHLARDVR